jgi:peptidylprolyl isomerase
MVPSKGKFSLFPRLLGRCAVTFRLKRAGGILGNILIAADGYTALITAGNFVGLCRRGFYTGLPILATNKRFGMISDQEVASVNALGSFLDEGFHDPLTAKLRWIPLKIIRLEKGSSLQAFRPPQQAEQTIVAFSSHQRSCQKAYRLP